MENEQNKPMQTPAPYAAGTGSVPVALDATPLRGWGTGRDWR